MHKDCIPEEVLRGKIQATKMLVKKQAKAVKQVETEILEMTGSNFDGSDFEQTPKIAKALREFYICIENAFGFIAHNLDEKIPEGVNVHQLLLNQMTAPYKEIRPPVIDKVLKEDLEEYMRFRSDLENDAAQVGQSIDKVKVLVEKLTTVSSSSRQQLADFFEDLNKFHGFQ